VLSLDALLRSDLNAGLVALLGFASNCIQSLQEPRLVAAGGRALAALERSALWLESSEDREILQAGARRLALTMSRALQLALLCEHGQWMLDNERDPRGLAAALRFARAPVDLLQDADPELDRVLMGP
jgi:hypothetical protein